MKDSVPYPNPDPPDPHVFGPPGSGSISQRYGSGSTNQQAKIVRKTLIPTVLWLLLDFLSLKNYVNVPSKSNKKTFFKISFFFVCVLKVNDDPDPDPFSQSHESPDPDPHQNVMDPEHWRKYWQNMSEYEDQNLQSSVADPWIRIRIRGSMSLTNGSGPGSCYFHHWPSRCQWKKLISFLSFSAFSFRRYIYIIFLRWKFKKKSQNSRHQGFAYYFCFMIEGSGSVPLTNGSGSGAQSAGFGSATLLQRFVLDADPNPIVDKIWNFLQNATFQNCFWIQLDTCVLPCTYFKQISLSKK